MGRSPGPSAPMELEKKKIKWWLEVLAAVAGILSFLLALAQALI